MIRCLSENDLVNYLEGRLAGAAADEAELHLDGCEECRATVADALAAEDREADAPSAELARVGRYLILGPIGAGSAGVVYKAYDPELDRLVALKLLRARGDAGDARARLLREAQALARLSHPHVVAIYETGTHGDDVYLALELVEGQTLRAWRDERLRSWREVLNVYLQAGRGLAAAHDAGLVHRDFKPDNALIGADGRVRVTDFGLARPTGDERERGLPAAALRNSMTVSAVTRAGALVGSPAYMAPEQLGARPGDARSNVWSFCVALHEALHGVRPFDGKTIGALREQQVTGQLRETGKHVPVWVRRAVRRGLAIDPEGRYPSMNELLAVLGRDPRHGRRALVVAGAVALASVGLVVTGARDRAPLCGDAERKLIGIWDDAQRARVAGSFAASGHPEATEIFARTAGLLDRWAGRWTAMRVETCQATHMRGEQSAALLDLRMGCLDERLQRLHSLVELYAAPDREVVGGASEAAANLESLAECARPASLTARVAPPADPAKRAAIKELGRRLADARALGDAGLYARGEVIAREVADRARAVGHAPLLAEAQQVAGFLLGRLGRYPDAEVVLKEALAAGERGRVDAIVARSLAVLAFVVGDRQERHAEGKSWAELGLAVLERAGGDEYIEAILRGVVGGILTEEGRYELAYEQQRRALALYEASAPQDLARAARAREGMAFALGHQGRHDEALALLEEALRLRRAASGRRHPEAAYGQMVLGRQLQLAGRAVEARAQVEEAIQLLEQGVGASHPWVGTAHNNLGEILVELGRPAEALDEHRRARGIFERSGGASTKVAKALSGEGAALLALGRAGEAVEVLERAVALGAGQPGDLAEVRFTLARALRAAHGDEGRARNLAVDARAALAADAERYPSARNREKVQAVDLWLAQAQASLR